MGNLPERDMGSMRLHTLPNFWLHASGDHAVSTRLTPSTTTTTLARVDWLVHKDAVEGVDYKLEKLLPFWQCTSEQDWELCTANQLGVESSAYRPGPLSKSKEKGLEKFIQWYLDTFQQLANHGVPQIG
jgi:Rieske 2Fe-2S family protein